MKFIKTIFNAATSFINNGTPVATDAAVLGLTATKHTMGGISEVAQTFHLDSAITGIAERKEAMKESGITTPEPLTEGTPETPQQKENREDYEYLMNIARRS